MPNSAPRIDQRLRAAIADFDRGGRPIAEINRRVGELATQLGLPRPSYEQVRVIVHAARNGARVYGWSDAVLDIAFQTRSPEAVFRAAVEGERKPDR